MHVNDGLIHINNGGCKTKFIKGVKCIQSYTVNQGWKRGKKDTAVYKTK